MRHNSGNGTGTVASTLQLSIKSRLLAYSNRPFLNLWEFETVSLPIPVNLYNNFLSTEADRFGLEHGSGEFVELFSVLLFFYHLINIVGDKDGVMRASLSGAADNVVRGTVRLLCDSLAAEL